MLNIQEKELVFPLFKVQESVVQPLTLEKLRVEKVLKERQKSLIDLEKVVRKKVPIHTHMEEVEQLKVEKNEMKQDKSN